MPDFNFKLPDLGRIELDANFMRPSLVDVMIAEYEDLDGEDPETSAECNRVLLQLYELRAKLGQD